MKNKKLYVDEVLKEYGWSISTFHRRIRGNITMHRDKMDARKTFFYKQDIDNYLKDSEEG